MINKINPKNLNIENLKSWVFDLDNTLYPWRLNLFSQVDEKMALYISNIFDISHQEAKKKQKHFFQKYGTTLRGLMSEHDILPYDYLNFVHDIDFTILNVDETLNDALKKLPGDQFIYTNASTEYAHNVLDRIGLSGHFKDIFDIHDADFLPKPDIRSYHKMVDKFAIDPQQSIMVEDIAGNLNPAAEIGMTTVWVPTDTQWSDRGHREKNIHHIATDLPQWLKGVTEGLEA